MKKQRYSKQRQMILDAVQQRHDHPKADQLFIDVHAADGKISRGTVYRNLNLLAENGEIHQVQGPDAERFDCRLDRHYHLVCTECGTMMDAPIEYEEKLDHMVAELTGCPVEGHTTVFNVLCQECQRKKNSEQT